MTTPFVESYREIPLGRGKVALVDAADFPWLSQWQWRSMSPKQRGFKVRQDRSYAVRLGILGDKVVTILMHRQILGLEYGDKRKGDHVDPAKTLDNRRSNLRIASTAQNGWNARTRLDNTSGYKGVSWHKQNELWYACIHLNGKHKSLGCHKTPEEAHAAYCEAARIYRGEFSNPRLE